MTYINQWTNRVAIAALILAGFGLQACGDDDSAAVPGDDGGSVGNSGNGGSDDGSGGDKGGSGGKKGGSTGTKKDAGPDDGKSDGGGSSSDAGADSGAGGDCTGADDCYSCEPKTNEQILNHCTTATCQPYDNSTLTELLPGGKLPELPQ